MSFERATASAVSVFLVLGSAASLVVLVAPPATAQAVGGAGSRAQLVGLDLALLVSTRIWAPNKESWEAGDRRVACSLSGDTALTESVRGSER